MGRGGKGNGGFGGKGGQSYDDDQPGLDLASNYAESVAGAGGSNYGDVASVAAASVGRPASVRSGAPPGVQGGMLEPAAAIEEEHFNEPGGFSSVARLMNDGDFDADDLKEPDAGYGGSQFRQRPVSTFETIQETVEPDYGGEDFGASMPSYGDDYGGDAGLGYEAPVRSTLPSSYTHTSPRQRSPRQRQSPSASRARQRPSPRTYAPSSTNYSVRSDSPDAVGGLSDSDDGAAQLSSDSDVDIHAGAMRGASYSSPVSNRKFYKSSKLPKRKFKSSHREPEGVKLNPELYVEKPVDGDLGAGFDMMVQETTGGKQIGEEILEQNNLGFSEAVANAGQNRFDDSLAEAEADNTEALLDDMSELRNQTQLLESQLRREKSEQNRLMQTFNAFQQGLANDPLVRADSGGANMARIAEMQRRNAELRKRVDRDESTREDELLEVKRRQAREVQDLQMKSTMHEQEIGDLKMEEESLRNQVRRGDGGNRRGRKGGAMSSHMATIMSELEGAENHLDSMRGELGNQRRLQSEKDRLLKHQRAMLRQQQDQINRLVGKIGPNGDITVMINGEPVNVMDLLSQNGKLEAESQNWEAKLETKSQKHAALREEVRRMEMDMSKTQGEFREAYQEKASADSGFQQSQVRLQHVQGDVERTQNSSSAQTQKLSAVRGEQDELQEKLQALKSELREITAETDAQKDALREKEQTLRSQRDRANSSSAQWQNVANQLQRQVDKLHDRTEQTKAALRVKSDKVAEADQQVKTLEGVREERSKACEAAKAELLKLAHVWQAHQKRLATLRHRYGQTTDTMQERDGKTRTTLKKLRRENADVELGAMENDKIKQMNEVVRKKVAKLAAELKRNTDKITETSSILDQKDELMQHELTRANNIIKKLNEALTQLVENQKGLVGELKQVLRIDSSDQFSLAEIIGQLKERLK